MNKTLPSNPSPLPHVGEGRDLVLLINLGTPNSPSKKDIKNFLSAFLMDKRVVSLPYILRFILVRLIIIPFRLSKVQKIYQSVWDKNNLNNNSGSPLLKNTNQLCEKLQKYLNQKNLNILIQPAMTYGEPNLKIILKNNLKNIPQNNFKKIIFIPLYPQFSHTTTTAALDQILKILPHPDLVSPTTLPSPPSSLPHVGEGRVMFISSYFNHPLYIQALTHSIKNYQNQHGRPDLLIFSFHGLPKINIQKGDPYLSQCEITVKLLAESLNLKPSDYLITFQSRVGKQAWLEPYLEEVLKNLPTDKNIKNKNIKSIQIICPGFSMDCIETLEEIEIRARELFLSSGGEKFGYIPCLNNSDDQILLLENLILNLVSPLVGETGPQGQRGSPIKTP